jgi:cell division protein FtsB
VVNVLVITFLGLSLGREMIRSRAIDAEIEDLQAKADALTASNQEMLNLQTAMQTESFIEREARLKLGLKKPGEMVVVIQDEDKGLARGRATAEGEQMETKGTEDPNDPLGYVIDRTEETTVVANPTKWWYYFFDKFAFNALVEL